MNGLHKTDAQILLGMRHYDDAGSISVFENVVRSRDPIQHPSGLPHLSDQVRAGHCLAGGESCVVGASNWQHVRPKK